MKHSTGWSNASSPGSSGSVGSSSDGNIIQRTSLASFHSPASLSSSGDFEIGSSHHSRYLRQGVARWSPPPCGRPMRAAHGTRGAAQRARAGPIINMAERTQFQLFVVRHTAFAVFVRLRDPVALAFVLRTLDAHSDPACLAPPSRGSARHFLRIQYCTYPRVQHSTYG